ncbi:hypothetical protein J8273_6059 [Carpediemonas membranifera]|uniref:Uncharacterized protein n=1 Tax=Carpediemonas membranifera TaxID=201153 RepID=A0A8J6E132_9EUKA|nr:hypothetical protein J8273_6059 [Carpediemonas membranifera]|eukprot:KAG9392591.1 hypothetical protein J8273_6059 [Carpediemonas membranifera]
MKRGSNYAKEFEVCTRDPVDVFLKMESTGLVFKIIVSVSCPKPCIIDTAIVLTTQFERKEIPLRATIAADRPIPAHPIPRLSHSIRSPRKSPLAASTKAARGGPTPVPYRRPSTGLTSARRVPVQKESKPMPQRIEPRLLSREPKTKEPRPLPISSPNSDDMDDFDDVDGDALAKSYTNVWKAPAPAHEAQYDAEKQSWVSRKTKAQVDTLPEKEGSEEDWGLTDEETDFGDDVEPMQLRLKMDAEVDIVSDVNGSPTLQIQPQEMTESASESASSLDWGDSDDEEERRPTSINIGNSLMGTGRKEMMAVLKQYRVTPAEWAICREECTFLTRTVALEQRQAGLDGAEPHIQVSLEDEAVVPELLKHEHAQALNELMA